MKAEYYKNNRNKILSQRRVFYKLNPWLKHLRYAKQRCTDKNFKDYKKYGGKGIKLLLTKEEIKKLWFRDHAWKLKKPSIDRINPKKHYKYSNCRFIEHSLNSSIKNIKGRKNPNFKNARIKVFCYNCNKLLYKYKSHIHKYIFCSLNCKSQWQKKGV